MVLLKTLILQMVVFFCFYPLQAQADFEKSYFGQVQSFIEVLHGVPLISSNYDGRFRPYLIQDGKWQALIPPEIAGTIKTIDLLGPTPISENDILFSAQDAGKKNFSIYDYSVEKNKLTNLTRNEKSDDGDFCVLPEKDLISYHKGKKQEFASLSMSADKSANSTGSIALKSISSNDTPGFHRCFWLNEKTLFGEVGKGPPYQLYVCKNAGASFYCKMTSGLSDFTHFVDFYREKNNALGVLGLKKGEQFRKAYVIAENLECTSEVSLPRHGKGDVLELSDGIVRTGFESRYTTSLISEKDVQISKIKRVGKEVYAVAASLESPRTLATLRQSHWKLLTYPGFKTTEKLFRPVEVWTHSLTAKYQSFYFGEEHPKKVILWIHGGPKENVSPRFNPYFYALNEAGYGVLALNYPGSTGRGQEYEDTFDEDHLVDAVESVFAHLRKQGVTQLITWSVSTGHKVQIAMLQHHLESAGVVDQSGGNPAMLRNAAAAAHIPYFSIRGVNDSEEKEGPYNFLYSDGHDITDYHDFAALLKAVKPFLAGLGKWPAAPSIGN